MSNHEHWMVDGKITITLETFKNLEYLAWAAQCLVNQMIEDDPKWAEDPDVGTVRHALKALGHSNFERITRRGLFQMLRDAGVTDEKAKAVLKTTEYEFLRDNE